MDKSAAGDKIITKPLDCSGNFLRHTQAFIRGLQIVFVSFQGFNLAHPQSKMASSFLSSSKIEEVVGCVCVPCHWISPYSRAWKEVY